MYARLNEPQKLTIPVEFTHELSTFWCCIIPRRCHQLRDANLAENHAKRGDFRTRGRARWSEPGAEIWTVCLRRGRYDQRDRTCGSASPAASERAAHRCHRDDDPAGPHGRPWSLVWPW